MPDTIPSLFLGHGNPMNALISNAYTEAWSRVGGQLPRPRAVLVISAHWYIPGTGVTISTAPRTIHDFGGFPAELYRVQYPAPGDPEFARRVQSLLAPISVDLDHSWGLDHGAWSVLCHVYPNADIPVVQLSIDLAQPPAFHYELGRRLAPLRGEGILILGSGNLVHNLRLYAWGQDQPRPYGWAERFEQTATGLILAGDDASLVSYEKLGQDARLSIPTPEHYLPLLYVLGTRQAGDPVQFPVTGIEGGSVSMFALQVG